MESFAGAQNPAAPATFARIRGRLAGRALAGLVALAAALPLRDGAALAAGGGLPLFRHVDAALAAMTLKKVPKVRFLVSPDFPPFAYRAANGALTGFSVAAAQSLCHKARMKCRFVIHPWEGLKKALADGEGDAILTGLRMSGENFATLDFTRPYLKALGAFACRRETPISAANARALAGKRIGVVRGTVHAAWLRRNFGRATILEYDDFATAAEALRTARVNVLFGDWLQLSFWAAGAASRGCCALLPGWFPARDFAANDLAIAVRRGDDALRNMLDRNLDALQQDGALSALARRFLPAVHGGGKKEND